MKSQNKKIMWQSLDQKQTMVIIALSVVVGLIATAVIPRFIDWLPYDYSVYVDGARLVRQGLNPHELLPYWYPLPIVLFTTMLWSFLPDTFAWAFAFIPLGLLHIYYGKRTLWWWLFFPLLVNVAYAQAEGWLIIPMLWLIEDWPVYSSFSIIALMFKPAYGIFLVPYRVWQWWQNGRKKELAWLMGFTILTMGSAFLVETAWLSQFVMGVLRRHNDVTLVGRNMTIWALTALGGFWWILLLLFLGALFYLVFHLWQYEEARGGVLVALSLSFFPGGLHPVSTMMMPLAKARNEIIIMVTVSWLCVGLDAAAGGLGSVYLILVLVALGLQWRRLQAENGASH